jgi:hypothetical protein
MGPMPTSVVHCLDSGCGQHAPAQEGVTFAVWPDRFQAHGKGTIGLFQINAALVPCRPFDLRSAISLFKKRP